MILPTACINWAALRSGLSLPDFMASLDPEREEEILKSYNAWRKSKGLPEVKPVAAEPPVAPTPTTPPKPSVAVVQPFTQGEDREPQSEDEPQDDGRVRRSAKPRASISALQWAAERAGKSYGMFCLGLTTEDEAWIQQEYEKYQQSRSAAARGVDIE